VLPSPRTIVSGPFRVAARRMLVFKFGYVLDYRRHLKIPLELKVKSRKLKVRDKATAFNFITVFTFNCFPKRIRFRYLRAPEWTGLSVRPSAMMTRRTPPVRASCAPRTLRFIRPCAHRELSRGHGRLCERRRLIRRGSAIKPRTFAQNDQFFRVERPRQALRGTVAITLSRPSALAA